MTGAVLVLAALAARLWRRRWALVGRRLACLAYYVLLGAYLYLLWRGAGIALQYEILGGFKEEDRASVAKLAFAHAAPYLALLVGVILLHLQCWCRWAVAAFAVARPLPPAAGRELLAREPVAPGDAVLANLRTGGPDLPYRRNLLSRTLLHLLDIVVLPWLGRVGGCVQDHRLARDPAAVGACPLTVHTSRARKTRLRNPRAALILAPPNLDRPSLLQEVDDATQMQYAAHTVPARAATLGGGPERRGDPFPAYVR